jgi:hypothetical protein
MRPNWKAVILTTGGRKNLSDVPLPTLLRFFPFTLFKVRMTANLWGDYLNKISFNCPQL